MISEMFIKNSKNLRLSIILRAFIVITICAITYLLLISKNEKDQRLAQNHLDTDQLCEKYFRNPLTSEDFNLLEDLLRTLDFVLRSHNIMFWLVGGSLIGSYRHHSKIPWDDDADVIVANSMRDTVAYILDNYDRSKYRIYTKRIYYDSIKFYSVSGKNFGGPSHLKTPYVDIYFYNETDLKFVFTDARLRGEDMYKKDVRPLILRPYGSLWLPAPCNTLRALSFFNISVCVSSKYNHLREKSLSKNPFSYPCDSLKDTLTRVERGDPLDSQISQIKNSKFVNSNTLDVIADERKFYNQIERLMIGDKVLNQVVVNGICE